MGEVNHPGPYPAIGERRLFDLISAAGGLSDKAGRNVTIERRGDPGEKGRTPALVKSGGRYQE
jgi:protein involved in polysaccharide export with SLBB domain